MRLAAFGSLGSKQTFEVFCVNLQMQSCVHEARCCPGRLTLSRLPFGYEIIRVELVPVAAHDTGDFTFA